MMKKKKSLRENRKSADHHCNVLNHDRRGN
jgi:hypothetical protein